MPDRRAGRYCGRFWVKADINLSAEIVAFDAVDGATPMPSKCYAVIALKQPQIKEVKHHQCSGRNWRGHDDVMQISRARIGRTRLGQRIFECVLSIGTRSAQSIMASGHTRPHKQAGHMTAPDQCCSNVKNALAKAPSTHDP